MADQSQADRLDPPSGAELKLILREVKCRVLVKVVTQIIVNINLGWQEKQERSRM